MRSSRPNSRLKAGLLFSTLVAALSGFALLTADRAIAFGIQSIPQARPALGGNRAPVDVTFSPDGKRAYVPESAEGTVAEIDTADLKVVRRWATGGERPQGLTVLPGGNLLVANSFSGSVAVLDAATAMPKTVIPVPGMPWGVAATADDKTAYVSVSQLDEIAVLDLDAGKVVSRLRVGRRPRAVALTPNGKTLAVANMAEGTLSVIDTATLKETARVKLKGINVRGLAMSAAGDEVYTTIMPAFNTRPTDDAKEVWHNLVQGVLLDGELTRTGEDQWLDFARLGTTAAVVGSPDVSDIVLDAEAKFAWLAVAGRDVLTRITIHDRRRDAIWPISQKETVVGANPRGLALTPDGAQVWVANTLGNSVTVVDASSMQVLSTIDLGPASRVDPSLDGQYLFNNAGLTADHRFTCASCHPDGGSDGLTWSFVHVKDGMNRRNSRDLRAGIAKTAPFRWSGFEAHLPEFVESEVTGLLRGPKPTTAQTDALLRAIESMALPPNPYRAPNGELTEAAKRGAILFAGKAGCATCHAGSLSGGTGSKEWAGTTAAGQLLDVPHLRGAYDSAPYLHDGRAATLEEVFAKHNPQGRHGSAASLSSEELSDLLRFVREL